MPRNTYLAAPFRRSRSSSRALRSVQPRPPRLLQKPTFSSHRVPRNRVPPAVMSTARGRKKRACEPREGTSRILDPLYSSLFIFVANFILLIVRNLKYWRWPDITLLNDWNYIYIYFRNKEKLRQKSSRLICFSLRFLLFIYFSCFLYLFYKMLSFLLIISLFLYIFLLQFLLCFYKS